MEGRATVKTRIVLSVVGLAFAGLVSGCWFFGSSELEYTHWEPALSPDGGTLAYESPAEESLELYLRDLASGETRRLTEDEYPDWSPSWSPAGDRIAFTSSRDDNVDIYVLNVSDSVVERMTTDEREDINPHWGADGRIYFNSNRSGAWEIYAIDPIEKNLVKITQVAETPGS